MDVRDFDFDLPPALIAQEPPVERGGSRLLYIDRDTGAVEHSTVAALPTWLRPGDLLVVNDTRVFPARLLGRREPSGGAVECLLIGRSNEPLGDQPGELWEALMHPGQKLKPGARVSFGDSGVLRGEVLEQRFFGRRIVRLWTTDGSRVEAVIDAIGHVPLPPYIKRPDRDADRERYQTVFARVRGSVAAPTAGLHFTTTLIDDLARRGVQQATITLHVGYGTFQPVRVDVVEQHHVEPERYEVPESTAAAIRRAKAEKRRVIAVGTTTTRALEAAAAAHGEVVAGAGIADLFIYPGFQFRAIDGLVTNFHLPKSSLLMLVCAFAGRERVMGAYRQAIASGYRFYSYGDAMLIA